MNFWLVVFYVVSFLVLLAGGVSLLYYPLALWSAVRRRRRPVFDTDSPLVSVVVPAYNEEKVIGHCVESILASNYRNFEVILVDDGSRDQTLAVMKRYEGARHVKVVAKPNGGKAAALNAGFAVSKGEILLFVDADGIFTPQTIDRMLAAFTDPKVGAVCGNDAPVNLDRPLTQLMCLQTHVGTGMVRRALAELNCLPIVSGNSGAFRRAALEQAGPIGNAPVTPEAGPAWVGREQGPFKEGFIGEDLELTWRIHRAGYRVAFAPTAVVLAEVPSTVRSLWRQRVRWARGLLQTVGLHWRMFANLKYGAVGLYLPLNFFNMVVVPMLQLGVVVLLTALLFSGYRPIALDLLGFLAWLGVGWALLTSVFSVALDRAWRDLKYLYVIPLWVPYSLLMDIVMVWAIVLELHGTEAKWNKSERTGVISRRSMTGGGEKVD